MNARAHVLVVEGPVETHSPAAPELDRMLAREGYLTRRVPAAAELRREVEARRADLVFWSATPDRAWAEELRAVKAQAEPAFLPVILLAPGSAPAARAAALRAGADDVIAGAWLEEEEVLARAAALLRIKASQDALAQAKAEAERQSVTDPLTGLFNRRYFGYRLQQELERGRRYGEPVSLLMMDLDHFKRVNDRYGHRVGDEALKLAAGVLGRQVRQLDVCTRWGGEELAVIMPNTDQEGGRVVGRRLIKALRAHAVLRAAPAGGGEPELVALTASLGLATSAGGEDGEALLGRADSALYQAKAQGRDRLCVAPDPRDQDRYAAANPLAPAAPVILATAT